MPTGYGYAVQAVQTGIRLTAAGKTFAAHVRRPTVFQAVGAAAMIGIAMFYLLEWLEKRVVFWTQVGLE
jgi:ABC-type nitrate/sulfonate/bicarbonate transport system permease component